MDTWWCRGDVGPLAPRKCRALVCCLCWRMLNVWLVFDSYLACAWLVLNEGWWRREDRSKSKLTAPNGLVHLMR